MKLIKNVIEWIFTIVIRLPFFIVAYIIGAIIAALWGGFKGAWKYESNLFKRLQ